MRKVKSKGRYPELVRIFLFRNGWGLSIVSDTFDTAPCTCVVRQTSGDDYENVWLSNTLQNKDTSALWKLWDWYFTLADNWPKFPTSTLAGVTGLGWARYMSRLPYDIHWNGLVTFVRPNGLHVCGQVDDVATEILRQYIDAEQEDLDLLEILCDRLEDHPV